MKEQELIEYVKKKGGQCLLRDAMKNIKHHYASLSSACSSLRTWINDDVIEELNIDKGIISLKEI